MRVWETIPYFVAHVNGTYVLVALLDASAADVARELAGRFGCSQRQARRYVDRAAGGPVAAPQPTTVFTVFTAVAQKPLYEF